MEFVKRTWAEISLDAVIHNFKEIKSKTGNAKICCVVKADGYGHGAVMLSQVYEKLGADFFAVSNIDEGIELRDAGCTLPILILGYTPVTDASRLAQYNISQAVFSLGYAQALSDECTKAGVSVKIHIKADTGMSRIGFMCQQFPRDDNSIKEICEACALPNLIPEGLFTHFCVSDEGDEGRGFTQKQYDNFTYVRKALESEGLNIEICHCSNSGAIEDYGDTYCDMVRAGIILYGLAPSPKLFGKLNLRPAMTLKTSVAYVKELKKGADISYGRTFTAPKDMKIATVPIGYADGFVRSNAENGYMLVNGQKAKIVGRICMDQTMLDVTDIDYVEQGDEVVVFGTGEHGEPTADLIAKNTDTINYEVVCLVGKRVPRIYYKDGVITEVMYKL
ncbi:alanine racemase [Ruminococcus sp. JL13D9]|uniref:alanine racemase n=1 Tax=Ruminococcus sp. JL13D9 TaxID=3233381 RepID=UPI00389A3709